MWVRGRALLILLLVAAAARAFAATYYVDPAAGSDSSDGLAPSAQGADGPWLNMPGTLSVAGTGWTRLGPGDRLIVKGGTLTTGSVLVGAPWFASGRPGAEVQILSGDVVGWGTGRAVIDGGADPSTGSGPWSQGFHVFGLSYIRIEGFEIRNMSQAIGSAGIYVDGNYPSCDEFVGNLIHEIYGTPQANGYGIEITGGATIEANFLIEKNIIYHTEEKAIELYRQGYSTIRWNFIYQTNDHGVVISSPGNVIYGNVILQAGNHWMSYEGPFRPSFGLKFDGDLNVVQADHNVAYDNLILDCSSGLGILNASDNQVLFNTVYHCGYQGGESGTFEGTAFAFKDDDGIGDAGDRNTVEDNIFYFSNVLAGKAQTFSFTAALGSGNTFSHNVVYRDPADAGTVVFLLNGLANSWHSVDWLQGSSGFSAFGSGNTATGNVAVDPAFAGGVGAALMAGLPTGLDGSFHPNSPAFQLSASSPLAVLMGDHAMPAPFTVDIVGRIRTLFSLGAYEQTAIPLQGPPAPTGLRIKN